MRQTIISEKYVVELSEAEKSELRRLTTIGKASARKIKRANILLLSDGGQSDKAISAMLHTSISTIERTRKRYVEGGLDAALNEQPRPGRELKLDGKQEAHLIALACSPPPAGRQSGTMHLLAERLVALQMVESISDETVRLRLKKAKSSRGNTSNGASPK
jgi:transposase